MVCGIALGILGDFAASEDAGQEAFLTAWRKIGELRDPSRLRPWLAQIARNAALAQLRRRHPHESLDGITLPDPSTSPDEAAAHQDEAALVRTFLARLPETYRSPLVLYYREGQSIHAVAETLGISEDAAKQRLARGREMLRERMSGVIESVLTRTAPSATFTIAIAVAIGALAAPVAVAGTAFAASSVGTGSATTTSSLLTAMSTSKTLLIAAAIVTVAFIPIGYRIASPPKQIRETPPLETEAQAPAVQTPPVAADFESNSLFAEWRALHVKYGTNAAAMPALYKAIGEIKDAFRKRAFRSALIAEWVQVDPTNGLAFMLGKGPDNDQRRQFIEEWLTRDPEGAVDALLASGKGWEIAAQDCLTNIARRVPARLAEVAQRLPKAESYWDSSIRDAFAIIAETDLPSAIRSAESITGTNRDQALSGVAQLWAKTDFNGAVAWARQLPDGTDRNEIIRAALIGRASVDPAGALDSVGIVPAGGKYAYFATTTGARVLRAAAEADFDSTVSWLTANPTRFDREDIYGLVPAVTDRLNADPAAFLDSLATAGSLAPLIPSIENSLLNGASGQREAIWDWLKTQPDNDAIRNLKGQVLSSAAWQDPGLALKLVADLPQNADGDAQVRKLAQTLYNGGRGLFRFESLMDNAPERLREPLVEAAFELLSADYIGNPQKWVSRLSLLPESAQLKSTKSLAQAWAGQSPDDAANWVMSLASATRSGPIDSLVSAWARKDADGATGWVAGLAPGTDRDNGALALTSAFADAHPREAWDWALSISDDTLRNRAATLALKPMYNRDPTTARQWIDAGNFTPEARAQLLASISQPIAK
jgi:RNA polymerase sigma factor (sigma-70 family)